MITVEPTTESVNPLLPMKDLFAVARKTARTNFPFGRCDVMFNKMHVEQDATPVGLGMQPGDDVLLYPTFGKFEVQDQMKDRNIPGLNYSLGVSGGGLPLADCLTLGLPDGNIVVDCFKYASFYVGPIRNSTHENVDNALISCWSSSNWTRMMTKRLLGQRGRRKRRRKVQERRWQSQCTQISRYGQHKR